jgi:pyridoxal phosphate enzyme (YggS family)
MGVADNLTNLRKELGTVELVAVSKQQPFERVKAALEAGQRVFGENRVQEAQERWGSVRKSGLYTDLRLHLIGPLQTNKAADAVALFDVIEVVDREKLARVLAQEMVKQDRRLPCYIQVNTGEEEQKSGVAPADVRDFIAFCKGECGLNIMGLMCIPPADDPAALHFALLAKLARESGLNKLSMGMSGDYKQAIALGATSVRVGTGLFGIR